MEAEKDILDYICAGNLALPPLSFKLVGKSRRKDNFEPGVVIETNWQRKRYRFAAEVKRYGSDRTVAEAANQASRYAQQLKVNPLVIVPWLSDEQLTFLEQRGVSGVDLCGNGVIVVPGQLLIFKTGQPNKFPGSRLIRRIYEGTSSLVGRVLLLRPDYDSVSEVMEVIAARGGSITLSTVSKVLKQLQEDIVIERSEGKIRLLQPDKLLDRLKANYGPPRSTEFVRGKITLGRNTNIGSVLRSAAEQAAVKLVLSGESSVNFYAAMAREPIDIFYCTEFKKLHLEKLGMDVFSQFPNVELRKTDVETVYFDMRKEKGGNIASPVQAYLELATSDKRGQEVAEQIRQQILHEVTKQQRRRSK